GEVNNSNSVSSPLPKMLLTVISVFSIQAETGKKGAFKIKSIRATIMYGSHDLNAEKDATFSLSILKTPIHSFFHSDLSSNRQTLPLGINQPFLAAMT